MPVTKELHLGTALPTLSSCSLDSTAALNIRSFEAPDCGDSQPGPFESDYGCPLWRPSTNHTAWTSSLPTL